MIIKKETTHLVINSLILLVLALIIMNQIVWLVNMYRLHTYELNILSNSAAEEAVLKELAIRTEEIGGHRVFSTNINDSNINNTSRYITKKIVSKDSAYSITIDKQDPNTVAKITQSLLKNQHPIDLDKLNALFVKGIEPFYEVKNTYFDYIDLKENILLNTNKKADIASTSGKYLKTDTIPIDINSSIGIVGYVKVVSNAILKKMTNQLLFSVLLILIAGICLYYISQNFIFQLKKEKMRQESVNAMTHEFKRPISRAVAMVSAIPHYLDKKDFRKVLRYTQSTENELNKLIYYTQRIQKISNNKKQNVNLNRNPMKIIPFFESLQDQYNSSKEGNQEVVVNLHIKTLRKDISVDILHFSNVMDNLIENAIKYTDKPIIIVDIEITDTKDGIRVSVRDNGIGISSADKKHIFEKYFRAKRHEVKRKSGFGLGLTYVKNIIEAHGGNITVNSNLNEGSEFIITLKD